MGSRAVVVLCHDAEVARRRFGVTEGETGIVYTRTGRRFFDDPALEAALLDRLRAAATAAGLWERLETDWLCLDAELMPWSAKARALIDAQYRPVGEAAIAGTGAAAEIASRAAARGVDVDDLVAKLATRTANAQAYDVSWRRYVRPVSGIEDLRLAPFHLRASEGTVHTDKAHDWHMALMAELAAADLELLVATPHRVVDLAVARAVEDAAAWWEELTGAG